MKKNLKSAMLLVTIAFLFSAVIPMFAFATGESVDDTVYIDGTEYHRDFDTEYPIHYGYLDKKVNYWDGSSVVLTIEQMCNIIDIINSQNSCTLWCEMEFYTPDYDYLLNDEFHKQKVYINIYMNQLYVVNDGEKLIKIYNMHPDAMSHLDTILWDAKQAMQNTWQIPVYKGIAGVAYADENAYEMELGAINAVIDILENSPMIYEEDARTMAEIYITFTVNEDFSEQIGVNLHDKFFYVGDSRCYSLTEDKVAQLQKIYDDVIPNEAVGIYLSEEIKANLLKMEGLTVGGITYEDFKNLLNADGNVQSALNIISVLQANGCADWQPVKDAMRATNYMEMRSSLLYAVRFYANNRIVYDTDGYLAKKVAKAYLDTAWDNSGAFMSYEDTFFWAMWYASLTE